LTSKDSVHGWEKDRVDIPRTLYWKFDVACLTELLFPRDLGKCMLQVV